MRRILLGLCVASAACSFTPRDRLALVVAESDVVADHGAEAWSRYVDREIARCKAQNLPTPDARAACLGPAGDGEAFETALESLVAAQTAAVLALASDDADVATLTRDVLEALAGVRQKLEHVRGSND